MVQNGLCINNNNNNNQKRDQETKVENNSHPSAEGEQHTVRNKLKEDLHIM